MTLDEMFDQMDLYGFEDFDDDQKLLLLNEAYLDIVTREPWPFLEKVVEFKVPSNTTRITNNGKFGVTIATNTHTLSYTSGDLTNNVVVEYPVNSVLSFMDATNDLIMTPERNDVIEKNYRWTGDSNTPYVYYFVGDDLFVYPATQGVTTYRLYFLQTPAATTEAVDTAGYLIPARHHSIIVYGALVKAFLVNDDPQANLFQNMFEQRYQQMRNDVWMNQYDRTERVHIVTDAVDWTY